LLPQALRLAEGSDDRLTGVATALAESGEFEAAGKVVEKIRSASERDSAFTSVALIGARLGKRAETERFLGKIRSASERDSAFASLALVSARQGKEAEAQRFLRSIASPERLAAAYGDLVDVYAGAGAVESAVHAAQLSRDRFWSLKEVIQKAPQKAQRLIATEALIHALDQGRPLDQIRHAPDVIKSMADLGRPQVLPSLAHELAVSAKQASTAAQAQPREYYDAFDTAIAVLAEHGFVDDAITVFHAAQPQILPSGIEGLEDRFELDPLPIALGLVRAGRVDEALQWCSAPRPFLSTPEDCNLGTVFPLRSRNVALAAAAKMSKAGRAADAAVYLVRCGLRDEVLRLVKALSPALQISTLRLISEASIDRGDAGAAL
jgi:hypothetical protein